MIAVVCGCVYVIYIYIYTYRDRQTDRQSSYGNNCLIGFIIPWQNDQTGQ